MESGITGEIMNSEVESFTLEFSCVEEIAASECEGPKTLYLDSQVAGNDTLDSVSIKSPLGKESYGMRLTSGGELCPLTPFPDGETMDISPASDQTEKFALAPPKKKMLREYKLPTRRQLNFDSYSDSEGMVESTVSDEEDCILESVCKSLIELVVSNQLKEICGEDLVKENDSSEDASDGFKSPTSIPLLAGIAETCPDAPKRPSFKSRKLDQTIFRKLEFESIRI